MKIKIFKGLNSQLEYLEEDVNIWLKNNVLLVDKRHFTYQDFDGEPGLYICLYYKEKETV